MMRSLLLFLMICIPYAGMAGILMKYSRFSAPLRGVYEIAVGQDTLPPRIIVQQNCNGSVTGIARDNPDDPAVRTNLAMIDLIGGQSSNYNLVVDEFIPGSSAAGSFHLTVINPDRSAYAVVVAADVAGNIARTTILYEPPPVTSSLSSIDFGIVRHHDTVVRTLALVNRSAAVVTVKEIALKRATRGFRILEPSGEVVLGPAGSSSDRINVRVEYTADLRPDDFYPNFTDSVTVRLECGWADIAEVKVLAVKPVISAGDADFGIVLAGSTRMAMVTIINKTYLTGSVLTISGISGLDNSSAFSVPGRDTIEFPIVLNPYDSLQIMVSFRPDFIGEFRDTLYIISDGIDQPADGVFSVLTGTGVAASLYMADKDWGRCRVGGSYDAVAILRNLSDDSLHISGVSYTGDTDAFTVANEAKLPGLIFPPHTQFPVIVRFNPESTGPHECFLRIATEQSQQTLSVLLKGFGTAPELIVTDYEFVLRDNEEEATNIINISAPETESLDSVTITGLWIAEAGAGGEFTMHPTGEKFLPVVLKKGDELEFLGIFRRIHSGAHSAVLHIETRDGIAGESRWSARRDVSSVEPVRPDVTIHLRALSNPVYGDHLPMSFSAGRGAVVISLADAAGRTIREVRLHQEEGGDGTVDIDVSGLPTGSYLLGMFSDGNAVSERVVIIH